MYFYYHNMPVCHSYGADDYGPVFKPKQPFDNSFQWQVPHYEGNRQQPLIGQATWTDGGPITQCGIPWSHNQFMTVAVGQNTPYYCGQELTIRNRTAPFREITVTVVDKVPNYPPNRVNLHRRAFTALGANPSLGVLEVDIIPSEERDTELWGRYLQNVTQTAYPDHQLVANRALAKYVINPNHTTEIYDYTLQAPEELITVRGQITYNPTTNRPVSINLWRLAPSG